MSLREEQCNKVCRILDDVLANRPTERDSLILAVRKAFAEPQERKGTWIQFPSHNAYKCSECGRVIETTDGKNNVCKHYPYCHCGCKMEVEHDSKRDYIRSVRLGRGNSVEYATYTRLQHRIKKHQLSVITDC